VQQPLENRPQTLDLRLPTFDASNEVRGLRSEVRFTTSAVRESDRCVA
jgi:hypothetical protein